MRAVDMLIYVFILVDNKIDAGITIQHRVAHTHVGASVKWLTQHIMALHAMIDAVFHDAALVFCYCTLARESFPRISTAVCIAHSRPPTAHFPSAYFVMEVHICTGCANNKSRLG